MNQADEAESIGHGRELAPDSIPGKKESAIEQGDELPTHILSVRVRLAELISSPAVGRSSMWVSTMLGIHSLKPCRYLTGVEPEHIAATASVIDHDGRFKEVEENVSWTMKFPSGIVASCITT